MLLAIGLRNILFILGVVLLLRLIGKVMMARRNVNEQKQQEAQEKAIRKAKQDFGKTTIQNVDKQNIKNADYSDFEEID